MLFILKPILIIIPLWFLFTPNLAHAEIRLSYTISGIEVNERGETAIEAQQKAFAVARYLAAQELVEKLTLASDRQIAGETFTISFDTAQKLAIAIDVEDEKRGPGQYIATLSVVFNPQAVRVLLEQANIPYMDRQSALALLVPVSNDPVVAPVWFDIWPEADLNILSPFIRAMQIYALSAQWEDLWPEIQAIDGQTAILAELNTHPKDYLDHNLESDLDDSLENYTVELRSYSQAGIDIMGTIGPYATMNAAAEAAQDYIQTVWKQNNIIHSKMQTSVEVLAFYNTLADWNRLRSVLARSPLVSGFQIRALARDGALITFTYSGAEDRLIASMKRAGVIIDNSDTQNWVIRLGDMADR